MRSVDDREIGEPGEITRKIQETYFADRARRGSAIQRVVGICPTSDVPSSVEIYDTTLRDGAQLEGISLTVDDKLRIAEQLDWLGVHYIEAGWPGSNPKDDEALPPDPPRAEAPDEQGRRVRLDARA